MLKKLLSMILGVIMIRGGSKMRTRITTIILSLAMGITSVGGGAGIVYAAEIPVATTATTLEQLATPQESDYTTKAATRSVVSQIAKKAIKFIIKNKQAASEVVERVAGKTVAKNFLKHFNTITKAIEPLLAWSDIPAQAVYDAVFRGLYNAGVSRAVATNIALAIKEGLSWFI